jgi:pyrroloquinoline quinone biosynthesis protein E
MDGPFGLLAELTYGCPLHCPYCSNPLDLAAYADELTTAEWQRVLAEGRELGVLQLHLSGGEPLLRRDLDRIVRTASGLGLYTNLITSGLGLTPRRAGQLRDAGLDHVQISVQADEPALSDRIAGARSFDPAPRQHRPDGRPPRAGRRTRGRPRRAGQYPVLRLGVAQP